MTSRLIRGYRESAVSTKALPNDPVPPVINTETPSRLMGARGRTESIAAIEQQSHNATQRQKLPLQVTAY
jgi:hypothetical protein